jgi:RPA family protein
MPGGSWVGEIVKQPITVERALQILGFVQVYKREQTTLQVEVFRPGAVGGTPRVAIVGMQAGFDWDNGAMLLKPESRLTTLTPEDVAAIHDSARKGQSWHAFQQYKKQADRIKELEAEVAALKQGGV